MVVLKAGQWAAKKAVYWVEYSVVCLVVKMVGRWVDYLVEHWAVDWVVW